MNTLLAAYEGGRLRPTQPLPLPEGETVAITVSRRTDPPTVPLDNVLEQRLRDAASLEDLFAAAESAAAREPDDGYDLLLALEANRQQAHVTRSLLPPGDAP